MNLTLRPDQSRFLEELGGRDSFRKFIDNPSRFDEWLDLEGKTEQFKSFKVSHQCVFVYSIMSNLFIPS